LPKPTLLPLPSLPTLPQTIVPPFLAIPALPTNSLPPLPNIIPSLPFDISGNQKFHCNEALTYYKHLQQCSNISRMNNYGLMIIQRKILVKEEK